MICTFPTRDASGAPITLVSGSIAVYKDDGATPIVAGITLDTDENSFVGNHYVEIDIASHAATYTAGTYRIKLATGTVDGVDQSGYDVARFTIGQYMSRSEIEEVVTIETGGAAQLTATEVPRQLTFFVGSEGAVSRNIITLKAWSSGTRTLAYDLSELLDQANTTINTVTSVTVAKSGTSITTSNLRKHQEQKKAIWETAAISSANTGTYTVTITLVTIDSNTIVVTGTLEVE